MEYLFNDLLIYNPDDGTLRTHLMDDHDVVTLTPVLNRIMLLLLTKQGEVITREEFFDKVWDNYGRTGSSNTLKQYIGTLRKIVDSHLEMPSIETIPRLGYRLSPAITITPLSVASASDTQEITEEALQADSHIQEEPLPIPPGAKENLFSHTKPYVGIILLCLILASGLFILNLAPSFFAPSTPISMYPVSTIDSCPVLSDKRPVDNDEKSILINEIANWLKTLTFHAEKEIPFTSSIVHSMRAVKWADMQCSASAPARM